MSLPTIINGDCNWVRYNGLAMSIFTIKGSVFVILEYHGAAVLPC